LTEMKNQGDRFNHLGLIAGDGRRKPAFNAYRSAIRTLAGLSYESSLPVPGGYGYRFAGSGGDGRAIIVLWADKATTYRLAESAPSVVLTGMDGRSRTVRTQAGTVALSLSPSPIPVTRGKP